MSTVATRPRHSFNASHGAAVAAKVPSAEFLSFRLGDEEYGIDILRVQEIRSYEKPTRIANAAGHVDGVIDLRGVIVPILDLRAKLGLESVPYTEFTVVIVLQANNQVQGVVVDSVSDVVRLDADAIKPAPDMDSVMASGSITGLGCMKVGEEQRMLILLDLDLLMA